MRSERFGIICYYILLISISGIEIISNGVISTMAFLLQTIALLISLIFVARITVTKPKYTTSILSLSHVMIFIYMMYILIEYTFSSTPVPTTMMKSLLFVLAAITIGDYSSNLLSKKEIRFFLVAIIIVNIIYGLISISRMKSLANVDDVTSAAGYIYMSLIPLIAYILWNRKVLMMGVLLSLYIMILLASKRGAIIISTLFLITIVIYNIKDGAYKNKFSTLCFSLVFILGLVGATKNIFENNNYLNSRLEQTLEGNSSGRDEIYTKIWNGYLEEYTATELIFGRGCSGSITISGLLRAHNDYLEILVDFGLINLILFLLMPILIFRYINRKEVKVRDKCILALVLCSWCIQSMFSMYLFSMSSINYMLILGIIIGNHSQEKYYNQRLISNEKI